MNATKTLFLICFCLTVLAWRVIGQSPNLTSQVAASAAVSVSPAATISPSPSDESDLEKAIKHKTKRHFGFTIDGDDKDLDSIVHHGSDDVPEMVIPIVAITLLTVFGAPVLIVGLIMYFSFSKSRAMHRTVRMMVEKGQPVPEALLAAPPPAVRQRSDMRRGVIWTMFGIGFILFLGAVNDWEGGAWSIGLIPFLIGCGYLLVWKLEGGKKEIPPPLPPA